MYVTAFNSVLPASTVLQNRTRKQEWGIIRMHWEHYSQVKFDG